MTNAVLQERLAEKLADSLVRPLPDLTLRRLHGPSSLPGKATAVVGMRRAGKTTFLHQVRQERLAAGVGRERLPFINFEDERLAGIGAEDLGAVVESHYRQFPELRRKELVTWCFDEIQLVPDWERFVRRMLDEENVEIFVSGSSAALLSKEIATALRGRAWTVLLHPFSFEEFLRHRGWKPPNRGTSADRSALEHWLLEFLGTGGFPEVQRFDPATRAALLRDYVDVAMLRDVVERHGVTHVVALRWLVRHLLGNAGSKFSAEKFHAALRSQGFSISKDTVHSLVAHLQDCFLVRTAWMEATSERQRMVNPRKAYPIDTALIPIFDRTGRANIGHALETAVFIELERRRMEITYVRAGDGLEVDFLARSDSGETELIQVCADARDPETAAREIRGLSEAAKAHPAATQRLLVLTRDALPREIPKGVQAQAAHDWLLARG